MGEGLSDLWGLGESAAEAASEIQQAARSAFDDAIGAVNEGLQSAVTSAAPDEHSALDADRNKIYEAYQVASSQFGEDEAAGQAAMDRVIAAAGSLGEKASQAAAAASAAHDHWTAQETHFDDMMRQVNELSEAGHPKGEALQQVCQSIRDKANGRNYGDCNTALEQFGPKLDTIMQEYAAAPYHEYSEDEEIAAPAYDDDGSTGVGIIGQAGAAAAEEKGWWDEVKEKAEDAYNWATGDDNSGPAGAVDAAEAAAGSDEQSWWDEVKEKAEDAYEWVTGDDEGESDYEDRVETEYGYNEEDEGEEVSDTGDEGEKKTGSYNERSWDELSGAEQQAWGVLGWDRDKWDNGPPPPSASKSWSQLTDQERAAAISLGYKTAEAWDGDDPLPDNGWFDESPERQAAWRVLGWGPHNWEGGPPPPTSQMTWDQLTPEQQQAATLLGYKPETWNAEKVDYKPTAFAKSHTFPINKSIGKLVTFTGVSVKLTWVPDDPGSLTVKGGSESGKSEKLIAIEKEFQLLEVSKDISIDGSVEVSYPAGLQVKAKTSLSIAKVGPVDVTLDPSFILIEAEKHDPTEPLGPGEYKMGPAKVKLAAFSLTLVGKQIPVPLLDIGGTLKVEGEAVFQPNWSEIGKRIGQKVAEAVAAEVIITVAFIAGGVLTIYFTYKTLSEGVNPDAHRAEVDRLVSLLVGAYMAGLMAHDSPPSGSPASLVRAQFDAGKSKFHAVKAQMINSGEIDDDASGHNAALDVMIEKRTEVRAQAAGAIRPSVQRFVWDAYVAKHSDKLEEKDGKHVFDRHYQKLAYAVAAGIFGEHNNIPDDVQAMCQW